MIRTGNTVQKVASSEWNAAIRIPLFTLEKIAGIGEEHFLDTWSEDDRAHGALNKRMSQQVDPEDLGKRTFCRESVHRHEPCCEPIECDELWRER